MSASDFLQFISSYLLRLFIIIFFKTYIDPVLKNLEYNMRKLAKFLANRYPRLKPALKNYLKSNISDENIKFYLGF